MEADLSKVAERAEQKRRRKIRLAKLKEIFKAWEDLFFILTGEEVYKKFPGFDDYSSFERLMRRSFDKSWQKHLTEGKFAERDDIEPPIALLDALGDLLKVNFTPSQDGEEIAMDLILLKEYYRSNFSFPSIEMALDLSLCKLIGAVNRLYGAARARGETILTGRKKQEETVVSSQIDVMEAFYHLEIKNKRRYKSKRQIAKAIEKYLISKNKEVPSEKQKKVPSERTIIRYLISDDRIRNDLIEMGVIKDKPTLV